MKKLSLCLVALLIFSFVSQVFAITDEEIFRAFSLNLSTPGARARAMGGAFIGRADDATAAETNPAGLTLLIKPELAAEYRYSNSKSVATNIVQIPVTNFDLTPSPIVNPDPGEDLIPGTAEFHANDTAENVSELGFFSVVYPLQGVTLAFSRHELINTDTTVSGSLSSSPFHFVEQNSFQGAVNISQINYGISAAFKAGDKFSLGATLKIADFSFNSRIAARERDQINFGDHFISSINTDDTKIGFNGGILVRPTPKISIGAVYRYEPKFSLDAVVTNTDFHPNPLIIERTGVNKVDFDVPDTFGVGVSLSPTQNWNINVDVLRILYSQLENVDTGYSLFTHLLPLIENANDITFAVDDGTDYHAGAEYLIIGQSYTTAVRFGFYRESRNRFFLSQAANPQIENFLRPIFGTNAGNDINHWTAGAGFSYSQFQFDFALDFAQPDDITEGNKQEITDGGFDVIVSGVYRF